MYIRDYSALDDRRLDAYLERESEERDYIMTKYWRRFLEHDDELDDAFEIEDEAIIEEIFAEIREEIKEYGCAQNKWSQKKPLKI